MAIARYHLGCPGWGTKTWVGRLFPVGTRSTDFLERYARVFDTVEGNTTFYALPPADTVARWREQVPDTFRFGFKFPRAVTHDKLLVDCGAELDEFFECIAPLRLGTLMLQLPPRFDGAQLARLAAFLDRLPRGDRYHYAVEPRHAELFSGGAADRALQALLAERGVDLVVMDARGLHRTRTLALADVRARKPNFPVIVRTTAASPVIRFVPHEDLAESHAELAQWADQVAAWIAEGKTPTFYVHSPDDTFAPEHAYRFHTLLRARARAVADLDVGELPAWPVVPEQLSLI